MSEALAENLSFEASLAKLDQVVHDLEDGQIGLEESLAQYELGVGLIKRCQAQLQKIEQRILVLTGVDETGQPSLQPFGGEASAEATKRVARKKAGDIQ
jgi:exodeoxyribonuclease VII small subunit